MKKILASLVLIIATNVIAQGTSPAFLSISDIHFNPLAACESQPAPCSMLMKLKAHDASKWSSVFEQDDTKSIELGHDTNYYLLKSMLRELTQIAKSHHLQFVILLGDMLPHEFQEQYKKYGNLTAEGYSQFAVKTMQFLSLEFAKALPNISVYFTLGNHDTDEDTDSVPVNFLHQITPYMSTLIKEPVNQQRFKQVFPEAGYYLIEVENYRILVLNSNLFSTDSSLTTEANKELTWLKAEMQRAALQHKKILIVGHKPMAIDVNLSLESTPINIAAEWKDEYCEAFLHLLNHYPDTVKGILMGHLHIDGFELIHLKNKNAIAQIQTPAISPIYHDQPGFKIIFYNPISLELTDAETYFFKMHDSTDLFQWQLEYDFNQVYQPDCKDCKLVQGMEQLTPADEKTESFKKFYAVSENAMLITKGYWMPYYWCGIQGLTVKEYQDCLLLHTRL